MEENANLDLLLKMQERAEEMQDERLLLNCLILQSLSVSSNDTHEKKKDLTEPEFFVRKTNTVKLNVIKGINTFADVLVGTAEGARPRFEFDSSEHMDTFPSINPKKEAKIAHQLKAKDPAHAISTHRTTYAAVDLYQKPRSGTGPDGEIIQNTKAAGLERHTRRRRNEILTPEMESVEISHNASQNHVQGDFVSASSLSGVNTSVKEKQRQKQKKCILCGEEGHLMKDCPSIQEGEGENDSQTRKEGKRATKRQLAHAGHQSSLIGSLSKNIQSKSGGGSRRRKKFEPPTVENVAKRRKEEEEREKAKEVEDMIPEELKIFDTYIVERILNEIMTRDTRVTWEDVSGLEFAKKCLQEMLIWPLKRPDIFTGIRGPPKGLLLFGPPGTGKTLLGKVLASSTGSTFFSISASSLTSKWIGEGEKMVRALFGVARHYQPSIIFVDEIDSLLSQRNDGDMEASRRLKTEFLIQLDGANTDSEDRVFLIGATNRPFDLDEAARRRMVKRLYIPLPNRVARKVMVEKLMSSQDWDVNAEDMEELLDLTVGYSGSDIRALCTEASYGPLRGISDIMEISSSQVRRVSLDDFKDALKQNFVDSLEIGDVSEKLMGYDFVGNDLCLRSKETDEPYKFKTQEEYEKLAKAIHELLATILVKMGYTPLSVPKTPEDRDHTEIYASNGYKEKDTLLIICQGSGAVRPGVWSRAVAINESLLAGTCLPYLLEANKRGWATLILNPNDNFRIRDGEFVHIKKTSSPEEHMMYVWKEYVSEVKYKNVLVVAHSYGGINTVELLDKNDDAAQRITAIGFTDSVHVNVPENVQKILQERARNFIACDRAVGEELPIQRSCPTYSSGASLHERTSHTAIKEVFSFLDKRLEQVS